MPVFRYASGEEIKKLDRVRFHGAEGHIEMVATSLDDPEQDWYVREFGGGVMVCDDLAGRTFIGVDDTLELEDLEFVSRDGGATGA
jgi:hypothetical protein